VSCMGLRLMILILWVLGCDDLGGLQWDGTLLFGYIRDGLLDGVGIFLKPFLSLAWSTGCTSVSRFSLPPLIHTYTSGVVESLLWGA
jgi:hypothetical protein